jgi:hypothetical protein
LGETLSQSLALFSSHETHPHLSKWSLSLRGVGERHLFHQPIGLFIMETKD